MKKLISFMIFVFLFSSTLAIAGITGFQFTGVVHKFNKKVVVLHQKKAGLKITIPRSLVKQELKIEKEITINLESIKGVKTEKLKVKN